tara:strand:+ start:1514 stop:1840 length:327 start_codon:yes stop_codon:yes gene_type:complete
MAKQERYNFPNPTDATAELIKRRRLQILVHSCMYYVLGESIISDEQFDSWSIELEKLLKDNPGLYSDRFDADFAKWDSASGFDLPLRDPWVMSTAQTLINSSTLSSTG